MIDIQGKGSVMTQYSRYPYLSNLNQGSPNIFPTGTMRYNNDRIEVYDGHAWQGIRETIVVTLSDDTENVIRWAKTKMKQDMELEQLMMEYPNVKDLKEKLDILVALVREEKKNA